MSIQQGLPYKALRDMLGHESRSVGALLGCFCGDALGLWCTVVLLVRFECNLEALF